MFLQMHITKECNLSCSHCYDASSYYPDSDELTTEEATAVIKEFASFASLHCRSGIVYLTGGAPRPRHRQPRIFRRPRHWDDNGRQAQRLRAERALDGHGREGCETAGVRKAR